MGIKAVKCSNCGSVMECLGKKHFRIGPINEVTSLLIYPELATPVPFDTYVCKACGKIELFADGTAIKLLKGEYTGDALSECPACGKRCAKEYRKCPYCGADIVAAPRG